MALLHCGFTSSRVISTLYALNYGQPAWMVGVILSTYAAIPALISIHVGKFIDKIGVRIPITVSFLMISAACLMPIIFSLRFVKGRGQGPRLEQKDSAAEECKG